MEIGAPAALTGPGLMREANMPNRVVIMAVAVGTALAVAHPAKAQQAGSAANSPDFPQIMPFATPYGAPITLAQARAAIDATTGEASRRFWLMNVAVVDSGGNLVAFGHGRRATGRHRCRRA